MATKIIVDAGHGGYDNGATFQGRKEKDDTLRLAMEVGRRLAEDGYDVVYTRTSDIYQTPFEKSQIANRSGADFFLSIHRNSGQIPEQYQGVQGLVFSENESISNEVGNSINNNLERLGFQNIGLEARPNLAVLRRTSMPTVLVEVGFINSRVDNRIFDENFGEIAQAIAAGIEENIPVNERNQAAALNRMLYQPETAENQKYEIQIGLFKYESNADYQAELAKDAGYDAKITYEEPYYAVRIESGNSLEDAVKMQEKLRKMGFDTLIVNGR